MWPSTDSQNNGRCHTQLCGRKAQKASQLFADQTQLLPRRRVSRNAPLPKASGFADLARQGGGAFVALVGIVITVAGLIGLKLYGNTGSLKQCTKGWKWTSSLTAWCIGQLLQLCAVELASEPVITAVSTLAVPANALLAWKILGEPVTRMERLAIAAMTVGAGMVVVSSPQQARPAMTVREEAALLTASVAPAIGLLVTLLVTQAG